MFPQAFLVLQSRLHLILKDLGPYFLTKKAQQSCISLFFMTHFITFPANTWTKTSIHWVLELSCVIMSCVQMWTGASVNTSHCDQVTRTSSHTPMTLTILKQTNVISQHNIFQEKPWCPAQNTQHADDLDPNTQSTGTNLNLFYLNFLPL